MVLTLLLQESGESTKNDILAPQNSKMKYFSAIVVCFICSVAGSSGPAYTHVDGRGFSGHDVELNSNLKGVSLADYLARARGDRDTDGQLTRTIPFSPIISSCAAFIDYFGAVSANFTKCVVSYARPLRVCENCVEEYLIVKSAFDLVMMGKHKDEHNVDCGDLILNSDRIQIIVRSWSFTKSIWGDCHCENCFEFANSRNDNISYKLSNETVEFQELSKTTLDCFSNNSNSNNVTKNSSLVCTECAGYYHDLNVLYLHIVEHNHHQACMDIVDAINTTRLQWSKQYGCSLKKIDPTPVFIISGLFCLLPIGFYLGNCIYVTRQQHDIVQNKSNGQDPPMEDTTDNNDSS